MNFGKLFTRSSAERRDNIINSNLTSTTLLSGIDLRNEFADFIEEHGHWVILRKYDRTRRSIYWNEETQSAIGGPPWEYRDVFVKASKSVRRVSSTDEYDFRPGSVDLPSDIYYLPYTTTPTLTDVIIEIQPCDGQLPTHYTITQVRDIYRVDPMRDAQGRVEYYMIAVENTSPKGDVTVK